MKKIILIALLVCIKQVNAQTPYVAIPDSNFVHYLKTIVPTAFKGDSLNTSSTLVTTTTHTINCPGLSIANLIGVQYFTSLTELGFNYNSVTSLPPLPNSIDSIDCVGNFLTTLPTLPNSLIYLYCGENSLTSLPALPNSLIYLSCGNNSLPSLPTLPNSITWLDCSNNQLPSLPPLPASLTYLDCHSNYITCFPTLPNSINYLSIDPNWYNCLPNYIAVMDSADLTTALCASGNTNGCATSSNCAPGVSFNLIQDMTPHTWDVHAFYSPNTTSARWYRGDGKDTLALSPSHTYSVAGRYNICVTAYSSCGDSAQSCQNDTVYRTSSSSMVYVNVINSNATGIAQISGLNTNISIYPNPNNGSFVIEPNSATKQTMQVYDVNGKLILSQTITGKTTIDAGNLNEGVYNISIISNEGVVNKRLVIVR